jgi:hypothetical protein
LYLFRSIPKLLESFLIVFLSMANVIPQLSVQHPVLQIGDFLIFELSGQSRD